eukprot:gene6174-8504_t
MMKQNDYTVCKSRVFGRKQANAAVDTKDSKFITFPASLLHLLHLIIALLHLIIAFIVVSDAKLEFLIVYVCNTVKVVTHYTNHQVELNEYPIAEEVQAKLIVQDKGVFVHCIDALKTFLDERLTEIMVPLGASAEICREFSVKIFKHAKGSFLGQTEISYMRRGKRFRNRAEIAFSLGLISANDDEAQLYSLIAAVEFREKALLSQQLALCDFQCHQINYINDVIVIDNNPSNISKRVELSVMTSMYDQNYYFSVGNTIILDWGIIINYSSFFTVTQIFPIGFKCIRQEHDILLDTIVDCLCEIDGIFESSGELYSEARKSKTLEEMLNEWGPMAALFRLTVAWKTTDGTHSNRVYEARSPQQVWQAAMLENEVTTPIIDILTIPKLPSISNLSSGGIANPIDGGFLLSPSYELEGMDKEELLLRSEVREARRAFFRALRKEQSLGLQAAVKPRLLLDSVDSFSEAAVLRLIEGMEGSSNLEGYIYIDSRDSTNTVETRKKADFMKIYEKVKVLDKIVRKEWKDGEKKTAQTQVNPRKRGRVPGSASDQPKENNQRRKSSRLKELEKLIVSMRLATLRVVKRRREEAINRIESICDEEEKVRYKNFVHSQFSVGINNTSSDLELRPEPERGSIFLNGDLVDSIIQISEFLQSFKKVLDIDIVPSMDTMIGAAKSCDKIYRKLEFFSKSFADVKNYVCLKYNLAPNLLDLFLGNNDNSVVFEKIGMSLTESLMKDYEKVMGIDLAESQLGSMKIPVNAFTWREIARVVLLSSCCKTIGMTEIDISVMLKGRGFFTTPESADRKVLKLARRRILYGFTVRNEFREAVYGFDVGLCVRIPSPSCPKASNLSWQNILSVVKNVPDSSSWIVFELIKLAAIAASINYDATNSNVHKSLLDCLKEYNTPSLSKHAKSTALSVLSKHVDGMSNHYSDVENICVPYDFSPYSVPTCIMDLYQKQLHDSLRNCNSAVAVLTSSELNINEAMNSLPLEEFERDDDLFIGIEATMAVAENNQEEPTPDHTEQLQNGTPRISTADLANSSNDLNANDILQAEKLSFAMQRCFIVIRDLMLCSHALPFLSPVDKTILPAYYKQISQPISLMDIRDHLINGLYSGSIFKFYSDVILLIENGCVFNHENSPAKASALKLMIVFERLFFETVLTIDNPLSFHDCCHGCRSSDPVTTNKVAVCDRCESTYHLHCLQPPLSSSPRSEWYCSPCVEQKSVAATHPYRTANVAHPNNRNITGEVVGIEQVKQTIMFVVDFGKSRELWNGRKVRENTIDLPESNDPFVMQLDRNLSVDHSVDLPSGYEIEDYDRVCGIARGYSGWYGSNYVTPAVLLDSHSINASRKVKIDETFDILRKSLAVLGQHSNPDEIDSSEWIIVLRSLIDRCFKTPAVTAALANAVDNSTREQQIMQLITDIQDGHVPFDRLLANFNQNQNLDTSEKMRCKPGRRTDPKALMAAKIKQDKANNKKAANMKQNGKSVVKKDPNEVDSNDDYDDDDDEAEFIDTVYVGVKKIESSNSHNKILKDSSDSESDLEFFDEQGNCLTSGVDATSSSIQKSDQPPVLNAEDEWELKQLSRQKGREDALLTHSLVLDVLNEVDVDEIERDINDGDNEHQDFVRWSTTNVVVKSSIGKPSESLIVDEWICGWDNKMKYLLQKNEKHLTCQVCGFEEYFLSSPLVYGQSLAEHLSDGDLTDMKAALASIAAGKIANDNDNGEIQGEVATLLSTSMGIRGIRSRNKIFNGLMWLPVDPNDASLESEQAKIMNRKVKSGSVIAHECCAIAMYLQRQLNQSKLGRQEDERICEIFFGLSRSKCTPLGKDRNDSLYWIFSGSKSIFVSTSTQNKSQLKSVKSSRGNSTQYYSANSLNDILNDDNESDTSVWSEYSSSSEIARLINWLDAQHAQERLVKRILQLLHPECKEFLHEKDDKRRYSLEDNDQGSFKMEVDEEKDDGDNVIKQSSVDKMDEQPDDSTVHQKHIDNNNENHDKSDDSSRSDDLFDTEESDIGDNDDNSDGKNHAKSNNGKNNLKQNNQSSRIATARLRQESTHSSKSSLFVKNEVVLARSSSNGLFWEGKIMDILHEKNEYYFLIHFSDWPEAYDCWINESNIKQNSIANRSLLTDSRINYVDKNIEDIPEALRSLQACKYLSDPHRWEGRIKFKNFSVSSNLDLCKMGMLIIESCLPQGSIDEADDRWANAFVLPWREAVLTAPDYTSLMACQIMLEYGIKTSWLKPTGLKLLSCLPSRALCMRNATSGLLGIRIFVLDATIKYDKLEGAGSQIGRPPKSKMMIDSPGSVDEYDHEGEGSQSSLRKAQPLPSTHTSKTAAKSKKSKKK